jgi:hypothetical protein
VQEVAQVVGVLAGGIDADEEVRGAAAPGDAIEPRSQEGIAGGGLGEASSSAAGCRSSRRKAA